jgi:hypothetical protein
LLRGATGGPYCGAQIRPLLSVVFIGALGVFVLRGAWNALAT